jgi:hypothetical protein
MKGIVRHRLERLLASEFVLRVVRQGTSRGHFVKSGNIRVRAAIHATTRREDKPTDSKLLANVSQRKGTVVVTVVGELDIDCASRVSDETGNPDHRFAAAQHGQHSVRVWNIYLLAAETGMTIERAQSIVPEPVRIDRYNLISEADQMST